MNDERQKPAGPRVRDVRRRFDRVAASRDDADFVPRILREGLLERLAPVQVDAARVLELGAATGRFSRPLLKRFPGCRLLSVDLSLPMLRRAKKERPWLARASELQASAEALPLVAGSVDVVVANLLLPWLPDPDALFREVGRVLRKDGLFAFTALGPDSLREIDAAFADDGHAHVRHFPDMHDLGDGLVRAGLRDPVLDVDSLRIAYRDTATLFRDLTAGGARNSLSGRRPTLTGKLRFRRAEAALQQALEGPAGGVALELIYAHAWGGGPLPPSGEFRVDVGTIGRRR